MDEVVTALAEQHAELSTLLAPLGDADWERPSRCEGWTVADVVLHLAQTDEMAIASADGRFGEAVERLAGDLGPANDVDDAVALMVDNERGESGPMVRQRWKAGADGLRRALPASDPPRRVQWLAGEVSVRTLATTRLAETWIHTGDVAAGLGATVVPTDRLRHIARLAWRTLPYAFARAGRELRGPVAFELRGPAGDGWDFAPDGEAVTTIRGDALELCLVAARRAQPRGTR